MAKKENKGGELTPEQVEQDIKVKGKDQQQGGYHGAQDTGDEAIRSFGTDVQQQDGLIEE